MPEVMSRLTSQDALNVEVIIARSLGAIILRVLLSLIQCRRQFRAKNHPCNDNTKNIATWNIISSVFLLKEGILTMMRESLNNCTDTSDHGTDKNRPTPTESVDYPRCS
jgi:hypothetical protein